MSALDNQRITIFNINLKETDSFKPEGVQRDGLRVVAGHAISKAWLFGNVDPKIPFLIIYDAGSNSNETVQIIYFCTFLNIEAQLPIFLKSVCFKTGLS